MNNKTSKTKLSSQEEAAVQAIATRMSEQISLVVAGSLREILFVLREDGKRLALQPATNQDEFMTAGEVAKMLKISKSQAYHMIRRREIPSFSIGKTVRVRRADLEAVIESHMT